MTRVDLRVKDKAGNLSPVTSVTINWLSGQQTPGPAFGMNLAHLASISSFNAPYEPRATIGRVYTPTGCTSLSSVSEFVRGMDLGIRKFHVSWKDTSTTNVGAMLGSKPAGVTIYGTHHHEPEDDTASVPIATWKQRQQAMMPVVRAKGCIPTVCFMAWTLQAASGRNIADWALPAGLVDVVTYDYYPTSVSAQSAVVNAMRSSLSLFGASRLGIGEYGVVNGTSAGTAIIDAFDTLTSDFELVQYWSSQVDSSKPNYRFTATTADAWFS